MASATATARADPAAPREGKVRPGRRPLIRFGGSRLGGFILALNLLSLLIERVKAVLRRAGVEGEEPAPAANGAANGESQSRALKRGKLTLDPARHDCLWDGKPVKLTVTEFLLLQSLAQRPGFVKSRDNLMDAAYDDQVYVDDRTIDSHIKRMRKKFREVDPEFDAIETLYGVGYRYREA